MSLTFGPEMLSVAMTPENTRITVTKWDGTPIELSQEPVIDAQGRVSFSVSESGIYKITARRSIYNDYISKKVVLSDGPNYDPSDIRSVTAYLLEQVENGGSANSNMAFVEVMFGDEERPNALKVWWQDFRIDQSVAPTNMGQKDLWITGGSLPDTENPTTPTGLASSAITDTSFTVTWNASTDNVGVTEYRVLVDGLEYATPSGTSQNITGRAESTDYDVTVQALDAAGNESAESATLTVTTEAGSLLPTHNVFSAPPATLIKTVEASVTEYATGFYTYTAGAAGWKVKGARLYVPSGISVPSTCEVNLYAPTTGAPTLGTPTKTVTMTNIVSNAWNVVNFPSVTTVSPGEVWWIGIKFADGTTLGIATFGEEFVPASDGSTLVLSDREPVVGIHRNYRRIGTGTTEALTGSGDVDLWIGADAIVEED